MYTDRDDLIQRYGEAELIELTDRHRQGIVDEEVLTRAIADAEALVDSYLAPRYVLPLAADLVQGSNLPQAAADIARYNLYGAHAPDEVEKRYERQVKWLRDLSQGAASLGVQDTATATPAGRAVVRGGASQFNWEKF